MTSPIDNLQRQIRACRLCLENGYPIAPNPIFSGTENARVMLLGQAPGIMNEHESFPFNGGQAGKRLFEWLGEAGWTENEFRDNHYIASVTRCYPGKLPSGRGDRIPTIQEQDFCREWLNKELDILDIEIIIPMGRLAINQFLPKKTPLSDIIGNIYQEDSYTIVPIPHPSGASSWYYKEENKLLLKKAITHLKVLKEKLDL